MRTIKFQLVFDTAIGTYVTKQSYTIEDFLNFRYGLDCLLEQETENFSMHDHDAFFYYEPKFIAKRQFTGLLDKNGIEIYDGDIIKRGDNVLSLKWEDDYTGYGISSYSAIDYEVIGNIFQHSCLLEANHE